VLFFLSRSALVGAGPHAAATVAVLCEPLEFREHARCYLVGRPLCASWPRQAINQLQSAKVKTLSRLHLVLAQLEAEACEPGAAALLLDAGGNITETSDGNIFIVREGRVVTPPVDQAIEGVTRAATMELAAELELEVSVAALHLYDAVSADEVFVASTGYCLLPISSINGRRIGSGRPGETWARLMRAWDELVGMDVVAQALAHLSEHELAALRKPSAGS
jgi:branched-chain amino acid aminotransferase